MQMPTHDGAFQSYLHRIGNIPSSSYVTHAEKIENTALDILVARVAFVHVREHFGDADPLRSSNNGTKDYLLPHSIAVGVRATSWLGRS